MLGVVSGRRRTRLRPPLRFRRIRSRGVASLSLVGESSAGLGSANSLTRRGVSERMSGSLARAGNASPTAFATAAGAPTMPASPAPFTPSGLSGTGCSTMTGRIRSGSTSRSAASSIVPRSESTPSSPGSRRWCAPRCSGSSRSRRASARGGRMTLSNVLACRISPPSSSGSKSPARVGFHLQREKTDA